MVDASAYYSMNDSNSDNNIINDLEPSLSYNNNHNLEDELELEQELIDENDPNFSISTLTIGQEQVIAIVPIFTSLLSIFGSSIILYQVITSHSRKRYQPQNIRPRVSFFNSMTSYQRLLIGLSCCDIIASITFALQAFLVPTTTSRRYYAMGSNMSCTILGSFTQFAFSAVWYNGILSYYYLLTIKYSISSKQFASQYESILHFIALGFNLLTSVSGGIFHHYGEASIGPGCWVVSRCVQGYCINWPNGWIFAGIPVLFMFLSIAINNCIIYYHVRNKNTTTIVTTTIVPSSQTTSVPVPVPRRSFLSLQSQTSSNSNRSLGSTTTTTTTTTRTRTNRVIHYDSQQTIQSVATQAFGYVGSFFLCYTCAFIIKSIESFGGISSFESSVYPLLVLNSIFLPLQGFFNMVVYCRPTYLKYRLRYPNEKSKIWSMKQAIFYGTNGLITTTTTVSNPHHQHNQRHQQPHHHARGKMNNVSSSSSFIGTTGSQTSTGDMESFITNNSHNSGCGSGFEWNNYYSSEGGGNTTTIPQNSSSSKSTSSSSTSNHHHHQQQEQQVVSRISSVLYSVEEEEDSCCSSSAAFSVEESSSNVLHQQQRSVQDEEEEQKDDSILQQPSFESAELQQGQNEEEEEEDADDASNDSDDSSRMSTTLREDDDDDNV